MYIYRYTYIYRSVKTFCFVCLQAIMKKYQWSVGLLTELPATLETVRVCIHICMYIHMYICIHMCTYIHGTVCHARTGLFVRTYTYA